MCSFAELNKVYGCVVSRSDHMIRKEGGIFDKEEFEAHPERYVSRFASEIAPYASVIINGVYWDHHTPRLITIPDAKYLLTPTIDPSREMAGCPSLPHRLVAICDISADPGGSIEFMTECTTIDKPFTIYDADFNKCSDRYDSICFFQSVGSNFCVAASTLRRDVSSAASTIFQRKCRWKPPNILEICFIRTLSTW